MALTKTTEKLNSYYQRLDAGKASKIKPGHVRKVIEKLEGRERELLAERATTEKPEKMERLDGKLATAREQMGRARWLLEQVTAPRPGSADDDPTT